jgi:hypothetical protein
LIFRVDFGLELLEAVLQPITQLVVGGLLLAEALLQPRAGRSLTIVVLAVTVLGVVVDGVGVLVQKGRQVLESIILISLGRNLQEKLIKQSQGHLHMYMKIMTTFWSQ